MTMGEKILRLRKARGWSQEELAEHLGVTRQAVSRWESNSAKPDADKIIAVCELFGISADYLLGTSLMTEPNGGQTPTAIPRASVSGNLVTGIVFLVLGTLMLSALALVSAIDPWIYSDESGRWEGITAYVLAHNMQWFVLLIVLFLAGGMVVLLWKRILQAWDAIKQWIEAGRS